MKFFCIADEDTILGFRLVGVKGRIARNVVEAREALKVATSMHDVGIIIITENIAELIQDELQPYIYDLQFPLIVEIPDPKGSTKDKKSMKEILKEAVGVSI